MYLSRIILIIALSALSQSGMPQNAIFLHHSTGSGVFNEGHVAARIDSINEARGTHYEIKQQSYPNDPYPWQNNPYDYWNLWINHACDNADPDIACLDSLCSTYNVIIFKHCFPGAGLQEDDPDSSVSSSKKTQANYKIQYRALRDLMDTYPFNKFIVWTLAPLHRLATIPESALRARQFVDWVKNDWLTEDGKQHPNIYLFDFFGYVAESNLTPENGIVNCLKFDYEESHTDNDSHPNMLANRTVGPIFADFIVSTIEDIIETKVTGITITGTDGITSITTLGGKLQLSAAVLPVNVTNKNITWSIVNGTGQASIDSSGMVTAIADGTVTAIANSRDGSGIKGSLMITISGQIVAVSGIILTASGGNAEISIPGGTLQLNAVVLPDNTTNKAISWSIQNDTGQAIIDSNGLVTAMANGTVIAIATAMDGSGISESLTINISDQTVTVTSIIVTGEGGLTSITKKGGSLQLFADVLPDNATNRTVTWSIQKGTDVATVNEIGLVTAIVDGTVNVLATANDSSGISGNLEISIENQIIPTFFNSNALESSVLTIKKSILNIDLKEDQLNTRMCLYNSMGSLLYNRKLNRTETNIDLSTYTAGVYLLVLSNQTKTILIKLVIQ